MPVTGEPVSRAATSRSPGIVAWGIAAAIALHAAVFIGRMANPLVISDAWYYVDSFLRKYVEDEVTLADFFARRSMADHALPFHKLLLLLNYRLFGVDLSADAWLGFAFALLTLLLLRRALRHSLPASTFAGWPAQAAWVAICAVYLSVNSTQIFNWPLLTLSFVALFLCVGLFWLTWRAVGSGSWWPILPAGLALLLVSDDGGAIAVVAAAGATLLLAFRQGRWREALSTIGVLLVVCIAYKAGLRWLAPPAQPGGAGTDLHALAALGTSTGLLPAVGIPFSAGVLHSVQADAIFHRWAGTVTFVLTVLAIIAHGLFWWQALRRRPTLAWFLAVGVMLLFYGLCAGVLLVRGPQFGAEVFNQPRYIVFYELHVVALLLMAACWVGERHDRGAKRGGVEAGVLAVSLALLLVQVPIDRNGWRRAPYERHYVDQLVFQMEQLAATPESAPPSCLPQLTVCRMPAAVRVRAVIFLRDHHLNVYSPEFRRRHDFAPD